MNEHRSDCSDFMDDTQSCESLWHAIRRFLSFQSAMQNGNLQVDLSNVIACEWRTFLRETSWTIEYDGFVLPFRQRIIPHEIMNPVPITRSEAFFLYFQTPKSELFHMNPVPISRSDAFVLWLQTPKAGVGIRE